MPGILRALWVEFRVNRVSFSQFSELAFIPKDQMESKWYSKHELAHIQRELMEDVQRARSTNATPLLHCLGVEALVRRVADEKRAHVRRVLTSKDFKLPSMVSSISRRLRVYPKYRSGFKSGHKTLPWPTSCWIRVKMVRRILHRVHS